MEIINGKDGQRGKKRYIKVEMEKKKKKDRMKDRNKSAARLCCDYFNAVLVTQSFFPGYSRKRPITITED